MSELKELLMDALKGVYEKKVEEMFSGVDIDIERQLIIWKPAQLKENIFLILATLKVALGAKYLSAPRKFDDKTWASILYFGRKQETETPEIIPRDLDEHTKHKLLTAYKAISSKVEIEGFDVSSKEIKHVSKDWTLIFYYTDGKLVLVNQKLFDDFYKEVLKLISR
jgi:hypothetical protein